MLTSGGSILQADPNEKKRKRVRQDGDSGRLSSPTQRSTNPAYANLAPGDQVWPFNSSADSVVTCDMSQMSMSYIATLCTCFCEISFVFLNNVDSRMHY